jgi:protein-S-isoprenylcysteine O-methyltransferase Ste14
MSLTIAAIVRALSYIVVKHTSSRQHRDAAFRGDRKFSQTRYAAPLQVQRSIAMVEEQAADTFRQIPRECIVRVPPWTWFLLSLLTGVGLHRIVPLRFLPPPADSLLGWVVVGLAMALLAWSERQFARHRTSHDHRAVASALITAGPFKFSRNPVYLGLLILLVGFGMALNTLWLFLSAPLAMLVMRFHVVPKEEACLEQLFPDAYPRYRQSVRRWL